MYTEKIKDQKYRAQKIRQNSNRRPMKNLPVPRLCLDLVTSTWLANWLRFVGSKKVIDSAATPNGEMSRDVSRVADDKIMSVDKRK